MKKNNKERRQSKLKLTIHMIEEDKTKLNLVGMRCTACGEKFECTDTHSMNEILQWWNFCPICGRKFDNA